MAKWLASITVLVLVVAVVGQGSLVNRGKVTTREALDEDGLLVLNDIMACGNEACGTLDPERSCKDASLMCYSRTCRYFDTCDHVPVALESDGTFTPLHPALMPPPELGSEVGATFMQPDTEVTCRRDITTPTIIASDYFNFENYYHFHVDLLIRLFAQVDKVVPEYVDAVLAGESPSKIKSLAPVVVLGAPRVGSVGFDLDTDYFDQRSTFWMQALLSVFGEMDGKLVKPFSPGSLVTMMRKRVTRLTRKGPVCLHRVHLGLPYVDLESWAGYDVSVPKGEGWRTKEALGLDEHGIRRQFPESDEVARVAASARLKRFTDFVVKRTGAKDKQRLVSCEGSMKVGVIARSARRRLVNEQALVDATTLKDFPVDVEVDVFRGSSMKYVEQLEAMSDYDIVVGVNGAGLINGLFLRPDAVAVQMVPFQAPLNYEEFGTMLRVRGPYVEWHSLHSEHVHVQPGTQQPKSNQDTFVKKEEWEQILVEAVKTRMEYLYSTGVCERPAEEPTEAADVEVEDEKDESYGVPGGVDIKLNGDEL